MSPPQIKKKKNSSKLNRHAKLNLKEKKKKTTVYFVVILLILLQSYIFLRIIQTHLILVEKGQISFDLGDIDTGKHKVDPHTALAC